MSSENKDADQLRGYHEADLCLCFRKCKKPVFSRRGSFILQVSWIVYFKYLRAIGAWASFSIFFLFILYNAGGIVSNIWLSQWTDDSLLKNTSRANTSEYQDKNYMYLGVYGALGIGQGNVDLHVSWSVWGTWDRTR